MNTVERAKAIRKELKESFPATKFSVRTKKYSGGSSISISWTDFPTVDEVKKVSFKYESISRCEYTGEILSGGNMYVHTYNTWSDEMKNNIDESLRSQYDAEFYEEHIEGYDYYRYARKQFENMYLESLINAEVETIETDILKNEDLESIIINCEEYTNKILKEELEKEIEPLEFKKVDIDVFTSTLIARKTDNINDMDYAEKENIIINKYVVLSDNDFNFLSTNLLNDFTFLNGLGGSRVFYKETKKEIDYNNYNMNDIYYNKGEFDFYEDNILITNKSNTVFIVVNPHGHSYARYTGILTMEEGKDILKQLLNLSEVAPAQEVTENKEETKEVILKVIESTPEPTTDTTNAIKCNNLYLEVEALERRLKLVNSSKLKYKLEEKINTIMREIAIIISSDPILYNQFLQESKE